jgi:DNA-directed RNA polymerase subunit RPC12/RpoP
MGVKILCAGGSKEEKEAVETAVRAGLGPRPSTESWTVSLVKIGRQWSVTVDGPEKTSPRSTFMAAEGGLRQAISQSLSAPGTGGQRAGAGGRSAPAAVPAAGYPAASSPGSAGERRTAYKCQKCGNGFVVIDVVEPGEGEESVAAACPHCWNSERVKVAVTAAVNNDFRVEKS